MKGDALRGHLDLLLLAALADGGAHGYVLIERLRERSEGALEPNEGSVYPALHRLEDGGYASSVWRTVDGRRRRVYRLTRRGRRQLRLEHEQWRLLVRSIELVLRPATA